MSQRFTPAGPSAPASRGFRSDASASTKASPWTMPAAAAITAVATASPPYEWSQVRALEVLAEHFEIYRTPLVRRLFRNSGIETRRFALAEDAFRPDATVDEFHALFTRAAPALATAAAERALDAAGIGRNEIDFVVAATCTGYLCPGLSAFLTRDLGLGEYVQRADLVGMGCAGALPALQRGFDFVRDEPERKALVVTVEVCSAAWYVDEELETVVGNAICADGAAAVVIEGRSRAVNAAKNCAAQASGGPEILGFETVIDTAWMDAVGLENRAGKHRIVLSKELRNSAGPAVAKVVDRMLARHGLMKEDISHWVFHAGGAAVLANIDKVLGFDNGELAASREVLRRFGNMSSPTTLFVLDAIQAGSKPSPGQLGIALALGPGLATEAALLRW